MKTFSVAGRVLPFTLLLILLASGATFAQNQPQPQSTPTPAKPSALAQPSVPAQAAPAANPADVSSMDAILSALYDVISGPAGKKRDWDRMRSLFHPEAHLIPTGPRQGGGYGLRPLHVDEYILRATPVMEKQGFYEREVARRVETFGQITHVFSTYESRHAPTEKPFQRGINSIQLFNDGTRWWVINILWQGEDEKHPLPEKYLKTEKG